MGFLKPVLTACLYCHGANVSVKEGLMQLSKAAQPYLLANQKAGRASQWHVDGGEPLHLSLPLS